MAFALDRDRSFQHFFEALELRADKRHREILEGFRETKEECKIELQGSAKIVKEGMKESLKFCKEEMRESIKDLKYAHKEFREEVKLSINELREEIRSLKLEMQEEMRVVKNDIWNEINEIKKRNDERLITVGMKKRGTLEVVHKMVSIPSKSINLIKNLTHFFRWWS
jgi:gas vesicle protein